MSAHGYLLAISLGPVQDFITASRKTRDLWFGSELLSRCAAAAARALQAAGAQLIYPALSQDEPTGSTPNKLLAILPTGDPKAAARSAEAAARQVLLATLYRVKSTLQGRNADRLVNWELATEQVKTFLEFYAAWVPYDPTKPEPYAAPRERVERLLAGRKALRDFVPAPDLDTFFPRRKELRDRDHKTTGAAKSSLDPGRDTVFQKNGLPLSAGELGPRFDDNDRQRLSIKPGEQLDGVSLLKRLGETQRFVSTARVAMDPFIRRLSQADPAGMEELRRAAQSLEQLGLAERFTATGGLAHYAAFPYDCQLVYGRLEAEERLEGRNEQAAREFESLVAECRKAVKVREIPAYFAVLHADGDKMGKAIDALRTPEAHEAFSQRLARFAAEARRIVARHHGALIYSGGDDVLAFLPLDSALPCADELRRAFAETVNDPNGAAKPVTLSVGLAIGHYGEHLQELVQWSRDAEKAAKDAGRNSLAVALHTRSGGGDPLVVTAAWDKDPVQRWQTWIAWHREDRFPDGAAYELRELARELASAQGSDLLTRRFRRPGPPERELSLVEAEVERILLRKEPRSGRRLTPDQVNVMLRALDTGDAGRLITSLTRLVNELIIARRIADAVEAAGAAGADNGGATHG